MSDGLPQRGTAQRRQRRQHLTGHPDIVSSAGTKRAAELRHELQSPDTAAQHSQGSVNIIQHRSAAEPGQNYECEQAQHGSMSQAPCSTLQYQTNLFVGRTASCDHVTGRCDVADLDHPADVQLHACKSFGQYLSLT